MNNLINVWPNMCRSNKDLYEISFIYIVEGFQIINVIVIIFNNGILNE